MRANSDRDFGVFAELGRVARKQYGLFTLDQALEVGLTPHQVRYRTRQGQFGRVRPGVFRLPGTELGWKQDLMAAYLWAGPDWCVAGLAAAQLWGLDGVRDAPLELAGAGRSRGYPADLVLRERCSFLPGDLVSRKGFRVTACPRTLIDCSGRSNDASLERMVEAAFRRGFATPDYLLRRLQRIETQGKKGVRQLKHVLVRRGVAPPSDSDFEILLIQALRMYGVPEPERQVRVYDDTGFIARVDFIYPKQRLILEADGRDHLFSLAIWQRDIGKRNRLMALGYRPFVIIWDDLRTQPEAIAEQVRTALNAR